MVLFNPKTLKTTPPALPGTILPRKDQQSVLAHHLDKRLILVVAGGGWGKSTFLSLYARTCVHPCLWYTVDEGDSDPGSFISAIVEAVIAVLPETRGHLSAVTSHLSSGTLEVLPAVKLLMNAVLNANPVKLIIILDDYHLAGDSARLNATLCRLLELAPLNFQFIVSTRQSPTIPITRLRIQKEVLELGPDALRFSSDEVRQYFSGHCSIDLTPDQLDHAHKVTEGWPLSIRLLAQQQTPDEFRPFRAMYRAPSRAHALLFDYIREQFFSTLPATVQAFLVRAAIFEYVEPAMCRELLGWETAQQDLAGLSESGMLVSRLDVAEPVYRYHHLFREFLTTRRKTPAQPAAHQLRQHAAAYFCRHQRWPEAFDQHLANHDYTGAAALADAYLNDLLFKGSAGKLLHWAKEVPQEDIRRHASLLFAKGWALFLSGDWSDALPILETVHAMAASQKNAALFGHSARVLMSIHFYQDDHHTAESLAKKIQSSLPPESEAHIGITNQLAVTMMHQNKVSQAEVEWRKVSGAAALAKNSALLMETHLLRGFNYHYLLGHFDTALQCLDQAEAHYRKDDHFGRLGRTLFFKASILYEMGRNAESQEVFDQAISDMRAKGFTASLGLVYATAALNASEHKAYHQAAKLVQSAKKLFGEFPGNKFWKRHVLSCAEAINAYHSGDIDTFYLASDTAMQFIEEKGLWFDRYVFGCLFAPRYAAGGRPGASITLLKKMLDNNPSQAAYANARAKLLLADLLLDLGQSEDAMAELNTVLALSEANHYDFLLLKKECGPARKLLPLALSQNIRPDYVAYLLARISANHHLLLAPFVDAKDPAIQVRAIRELGRVGCRQSEPSLLRALTQNDDSVREAANLALQHIRALPPEPIHAKLLGPFELSIGDQPVPAGHWKRRIAKSVAKYLIFNHDKDISAEHLITLFRGNSNVEDARKTLHQAITVIRRVLEPNISPQRESAYLKYREGVYRFVLPAGSRIDVSQFERLFSDAHLAKKDNNRDLANRKFVEALHLYTGEFIAGDPLDEWALPVRERLEQQFHVSLFETARHAFEHFDFESSIRKLTILTRNDSWNEEAYYLLMKSYFAVGDRPGLIDTYHTCLKTLQTDLGIHPNDKITALYHQVSLVSVLSD